MYTAASSRGASRSSCSHDRTNKSWSVLTSALAATKSSIILTRASSVRVSACALARHLCDSLSAPSALS